jgi:hypothetical protein
MIPLFLSASGITCYKYVRFENGKFVDTNEVTMKLSNGQTITIKPTYTGCDHLIVVEKDTKDNKKQKSSK